MKLVQFVHGSLPDACRDSAACAAHLHAQRLAPLVLWRLKAEGALPSLQQELMPYARQAAARDLAQQSVLNEILTATRGLSVLVMKGAATGPILYGTGALRPRLDTDVLADGWTSAERICDRLRSLGWQSRHQLPGRFARHAVALKRGAFEDIDVHARPCKRIRVSNALPFAELWAERDESLGFAALSARHGWLLGATHLTAHHSGQTPPKILLEDLVRLSERLGEDDWEWLWTRSGETGLLSAIRHAVERLSGWQPAGSHTAFHQAVLAAPDDESARFGNDAESVLDDLELLQPDDALSYLAELLLPPQEYLMTQLGVARPRPTALLRAVRLARGLTTRWRRTE